MKTILYAMRVAMQYQNAGNYDGAKKILHAILADYPKQDDALHLLGIVHYQTGDIHSAVNFITQAISHQPIIALYHSNLAEMHRQLKSIDLSIQHGEQAVILDPHSAIALSNLGIAYYDAEAYEKAEHYHRLALALQPTLSPSLNNMGSIYKVLERPQEAIAYYEAAINASPHFIEPINNLGMVFLDQENYASALSLFQKALQLNPNNAEAYYGLAKTFFSKHHFSIAETYIKKAIALYPKRIEFYQLIAEIYCELGRHTDAIVFLDQAAAIDSKHASLSLSKGSVFLEMGDIANATAQFLKNGDDADMNNRVLAYYSLVNLHKIELNSAYLQSLLLLIDDIEKISPDKQAYLYFSLGKCYDDLGEWAKSFDYFKKGCALKRSRIIYDRSLPLQVEEKLKQCFTPKTIAHFRQFANFSTQPIFIVGMPRSGTSLVEQILSQHPEIYGAGELPFLMDLLHTPENILQFSSEDFSHATNQYLSQLNNISSDANYVTDKMPQNFLAIGFIHALFPNAKIIHVKRNPIDTCLSCYTKLFRQGHAYSYDLTELGQYYLSYESIMDYWRSILPNDAWLDVVYENVIDNIEREAKRMVNYCQLSWNEACLTFYESKRQVRTASFMQVRKPIYHSSVNRWKRFEKELKPLVDILE